MRKGKKYKLINIYIPFFILVLIFMFVLSGIFNTEYTDYTEKFSNIYEEINKIPNTENNINNFKYNIYIVTEPLSIKALSEKLKIDHKIILYNNPYIIEKEMLDIGDRIVLYDESVIFYKISKNETLESISKKFQISEEKIYRDNSELEYITFEEKKYLILKNPIISSETLQSLKNEMVYENPAYIIKNQNDLIEKENIGSEKPYIVEKIKEKNNETNKRIQKQNAGTVKKLDTKVSNEASKEKEGITKTGIGRVKTKEINSSNHEINKYMLWPVPGTTITSGFGYRVHPILKTKKFHRGLDIRVGKGTPLKASFTGTVTYASTKGGYGKLIELERSDGVRVRYAHLDKISVEKGNTVTEGEVIGETGNTGLSTGPHLHFEILVNGDPVNPKNWNYF